MVSLGDDLLALASELRQKRVPFALATVVRCVRPTSAKPGAKALVRPDGTVAGLIGGSCAEPVVVKEALRSLRDGQPRLVALVGEGSSTPGSRDGMVEYPMTCHSGGTMEIFIEPVLPKPELLVVGSGPVVETLAKLGRAMDYPTTVMASASSLRSLAPRAVTLNTFAVVGSHGSFDEEAVEQLLNSNAGYVSLVASRRRAREIIELLRGRGIPPERLSRVKAPAGLDIGAVTPEEIAASILAEIIQVSRSQTGERYPEGLLSGDPTEIEASDPVCGMSVQVASAQYLSEVSGRRYYFCGARCKRMFDEDSARYVDALTG